MYQRGSSSSEDQLKVVKVTEGARDVDLLCTTKADLQGTIRVEWRRSVPTYKVIHKWVGSQNRPQEGYEGRTEMKNNPQEGGILTLNLTTPQLDDGGVYICTVYRGEENVRQKVVVLAVKGQYSLTLDLCSPKDLC